MRSFLALLLISTGVFLFSFESKISAAVDELKLNPYEKRIYEIKKATVLLLIMGKRGTGTLVKWRDTLDDGSIQTTHFILTNAHVCIENFKLYLFEKKYSSNYQKLDTDIQLYGARGSKRLKVKNKDIVHNTYEDFCLISVNPKSFSEKDYSFITLYSPKGVYPIAKRMNKDKNELLLFTRNYTKKDEEVFIKKGKKIGSYEFEFSIKINGSKKTDPFSTYERGPAEISSIDVVPGDSGSAIYDSNLNIVGLAFGTQLDHKTYDVDDLDKFLASKKIPHRKIPNLKNEIKEINGLFIAIGKEGKHEQNNSY